MPDNDAIQLAHQKIESIRNNFTDWLKDLPANEKKGIRKNYITMTLLIAMYLGNTMAVIYSFRGWIGNVWASKIYIAHKRIRCMAYNTKPWCINRP